jgi:hypothetical protein
MERELFITFELGVGSADATKTLGSRWLVPSAALLRRLSVRVRWIGGVLMQIPWLATGSLTSVLLVRNQDAICKPVK